MNSIKTIRFIENYICIGDVHIFIDFNDSNYIDFNSYIIGKPNQKIHIFITNGTSINETLKSIVKYSHKTQKFIIHIPKQLSDIQINFLSCLINVRLKDFDNWKIDISSIGPSFHIDNNQDLYLDIIYGENSIYPSIRLNSIYSKYSMEE